MLVDKKIGFIGAGAMAEALITGVLEAELVSAEQIYISDLKKRRLTELEQEYGVQLTDNNNELVSNVDYIILAVKPKVIAKVLTSLDVEIKGEQKVFSIAAGIKIEDIECHLKNEVPVIRLMPNTPALIGEGATAYALGEAASAEDGKLVEKIFSATGVVIGIEEDLMDAVTGLSGSGPAYVYLFIEALTDAGVNVGLAREDASDLALQTLIGAAKMVVELEKHPAQLKDMVTSPGGTTIAALRQLEKDGFRSVIYEAVATATDKAEELRKE
ncbi:pyrroline-5-carboxylate reductase [Natroniella sulfidigena]|uniref:pyrroline-5-carboxylate reductase n=1 Tax=Natroniella sulfidigena TaxID=723921 RepID=UPI002009F013|nr:pyrroline-5-carboxylate reductase [Natroniella sulfidigena]MCK8817713.1 pyrroline-5-carboxylate reductase [Natroniella sulfidigena]